MNALKNHIENFFEILSHFLVKRAWLVLIAMIGLSVALFPHMEKIWMDLSTDTYLPTNDPAVTEFQEFRLEFGYSGPGIVAISVDGSIFDQRNLSRIKALQDDIEAHVPFLDDTISLVSADYTAVEEDDLTVNPLFELWPTKDDDDDMERFKHLVMENPNYVKNIISEDGTVAAIVVRLQNFSYNENTDSDLSTDFFLTPEDEQKFAQTLMEIGANHHSDDFRVYVSGLPVINYQLIDTSGKMMTKNISLGLLILMFLLLILFRRLSGLLIPMIVVIMTLCSTFSVLAIANVPITASLQILPTFLLAIGIADTMHILSVFYREYDSGLAKNDAIITAIRKTAIAVLMTTATTAASLLSFTYVDLVPMKMLGVFGSIGVIFALIFTLLLVPTILTLVPIKSKAQQNEADSGVSAALKLSDNMILKAGNVSIDHAKWVLALFTGLAILSAIGLSKISMEHDPLRWFPEDHPIRQSAEIIDFQLSGTMVMEILVDTGEDQGIYNPDFLHLLEILERVTYETNVLGIEAKKINSILSMVKENHKKLNFDDEAYYVIPDSRELIAQEMLLLQFGGSKELSQYADADFSVARINVNYENNRLLHTAEYLEVLKKAFNEEIEKSGLNVNVKYIGHLVTADTTLSTMIMSSIESYIIAFILVGILMILLMSSIEYGMIAFIPNVMPIIFTMGFMGWIDMPLTITTSIIGCVVIGISVDDTIHFMHHFREHYSRSHRVAESIRHSLKVSGQAILFTSIVLIGCFAVFATDEFQNQVEFGGLLAVAILFALISNIVLAPALLTLFWRDKAKH